MGRPLRENLIGKRFTRLVVTDRVWSTTKYHWLCVCDCGNTA